MKLNINYILIILLVFTIGCKDEKGNSSDDVQETEDKSVAKNTGNTETADQYKARLAELTPIPEAKFKDWLPEMIGEYKLISQQSSISFSIEGNYNKNPGSSYIYTIQDGAKFSTDVSMLKTMLSQFKDRNIGSISMKKIQRKNIPMIMQKNGEKDIQIKFIWDNRFVVQIQGNNTTEEELWSNWDDYKLNKLKDLE